MNKPLAKTYPEAVILFSPQPTARNLSTMQHHLRKTTASKPFTEIFYLAGVQACEKTLRPAFAQAGYHRRVARKKPFLKPDHILVFSSL